MTRSRRWDAAQRRLVLGGSFALLVATAACASGGGVPLPPRPAPGLLPAGSPLFSRTLPDADAWLRHYLLAGEHESALQLLRKSDARERDPLLRALQEGVVLHHAGRYAESNRAFEAAEVEADRRYTHSIRRGAGSLLINDRILAYTPSAGETVLIPYFRMRNYLAMGTLEGAAVEARKANALITRITDGRSDPCGSFGTVQYLGGLVLQAAGEANEALVTLRLADRSLGACAQQGGPRPPVALGEDLHRAAMRLGLEELADSVRERYALDLAPDSVRFAEVVVVLDEGFAAHRVQQDLFVPIFRSDVAGLGADDNSTSALAAAGAITARLVAGLAGDDQSVLWDRRSWNPVADQPRRSGYDWSREEIAYLLKLAWPVHRLEANSPRSVTVRVGENAHASLLSEDVSARLVRELESRRAAILGRMVARGITRHTAVRELENAAEKKGGEVLGYLVGMAGTAVSNALEQADTRSWSLLPDQIVLTRIRVPAGTHELSIEVPDGSGSLRRVIPLGEMTLRPGERVFVSQRLWGEETGDRDRLMRVGTAALQEGSWTPDESMLVAPTPTETRARPRTTRRDRAGILDTITSILDESQPARPPVRPTGTDERPAEPSPKPVLPTRGRNP